MRGPRRAQVRDGWGGSCGGYPPGPALRTHRSAAVTMSFFPLSLSQAFRLCGSSGVIVSIPPEVPLRAQPQHPGKEYKGCRTGQVAFSLVLLDHSEWGIPTTQGRRRYSQIKESKPSDACGNDTVHRFPTVTAFDASFPTQCLQTTGYRPHLIDPKTLFLNKI